MKRHIFDFDIKEVLGVVRARQGLHINAAEYCLVEV